MKTSLKGTSKEDLADRLSDDLDFLVGNARKAIQLIKSAYKPMIEGLIALLDGQDCLIYPDGYVTVKLDEV